MMLQEFIRSLLCVVIREEHLASVLNFTVARKLPPHIQKR